MPDRFGHSANKQNPLEVSNVCIAPRARAYLLYLRIPGCQFTRSHSAHLSKQFLLLFGPVEPITGIRRFRIDEIQTPAAVAQSAQRRPVQQVRGNFEGVRQARVAAESDLEPVNR